MSISLKDSTVKVINLDPLVAKAAFLLEDIYRRFFNADLVITSGNDGKHMVGSLHYKDRAIDIRTNNIPKDKLNFLVLKAKEALGKDFDVVLEVDHLHCELDPK